jgi:hypothetical protein
MNIEALNLKDEPAPELVTPDRNPFWKRQFQPEVTLPQMVFDWTGGITLPLICFAADPIVFKGVGLLGEYRPFAFLLSAASILSMSAWLLWGRRLGWVAAPLAGFFIAGSFISFIVGIILLPLSLIGMLILIGFLGFTPLLSGFVFLRNGVRALNVANAFLEHRIVWQSATLAAMFGLIVPYVVNVQISNLIDDVVRADYHTMRRSAAKLELVRPLVSFGAVRHRYYESEWDLRKTEHFREMARIYERNTGETITYESPED